MRVFFQLTKVDAAKREVWGRAAQEIKDNVGETMDYESSVPFFKAWSEEFTKATDGKSMGNVRAMHQTIAAGKVIAMDFNDAEKAIDIGTKIIDDKEWEKVEEGVYTGFSVGGKYAKKWAEGMLVKYTAKPNEISLVDKPCIPSSMFALVKADGTTEQRAFKEPSPQEAVDELAKLLNDGAVTPQKLLSMAKAHSEEDDEENDDEDDDEDMERPDDIDQDDWDSMSASEKREAVDARKADGAKSKDNDGDDDAADEDIEKLAKRYSEMTTAEQNAAVEALARKLAAKDFEKLEPAAKVMRQPDAEWQAHVTHALRALKKRDFTEKQRDEAADSGAALPDGSFPIKTKDDLKNAIQAYGRAKDKEKAKAHIIARAKALDATDMLPDDWQATKDTAEKVDDAAAAGGETPLKKSMYNVEQFSRALQALAMVTCSAQYDFDSEGDGSPVPEQLRGWVKAGVEIFKTMAAEEADELVAALTTQGNQTVMALTEKRGELIKRLDDPTQFNAVVFAELGEEDLGKLVKAHGFTDFQKHAREAVLAKYGARHSKEDLDRLQQIHDHSVGMGACCDTTKGPNQMPQDQGNMDEQVTATEKVHASGDLFKISQQQGQIDTLNKTLVEVQAQLKKLKDTPVGPKGVLRAFSKGEDDALGPDKAQANPKLTKVEQEAIQNATPGQHNEAAALALIKSVVVGRTNVR